MTATCPTCSSHLDLAALLAGWRCADCGGTWASTRSVAVLFHRCPTPRRRLAVGLEYRPPTPPRLRWKDDRMLDALAAAVGPDSTLRPVEEDGGD